MKQNKVLFIVLGVLVLIGLIIAIWFLSAHFATKKEQTNLRNINVAALKSDDEKKLGTIIYDGAKKDGDIKIENGNSVVNLTTTDSVEGAFNIYYQDILNRYKTYNVSKKDVTKDDAIDKTAKVIVASGQSGTITVTIWGDNKGMSHIQIVTTSDFK